MMVVAAFPFTVSLISVKKKTALAVTLAVENGTAAEFYPILAMLAAVVATVAAVVLQKDRSPESEVSLTIQEQLSLQVCGVP